MKALFDQIFNDVIEPYFAPRVRQGSIKAVKGYIGVIDVARKIAITSFGIGAVAGVAVVGIVLMIVAIIGLLPIDPQAALFSILGLGFLMTSVAGFLAYKGFAEKKWLEMSKSYELMDAALGKWDNSLTPPNPLEVMKRTSEPTPKEVLS